MKFSIFPLQLRRTGELVPSAMHPHGHPLWVPSRLRTMSTQFMRLIEGTDMQIQRCMRGASMVRLRKDLYYCQML